MYQHYEHMEPGYSLLQIVDNKTAKPEYVHIFAKDELLTETNLQALQEKLSEGKAADPDYAADDLVEEICDELFGYDGWSFVGAESINI